MLNKVSKRKHFFFFLSNSSISFYFIGDGGSVQFFLRTLPSHVYFSGPVEAFADSHLDNSS